MPSRPQHALLRVRHRYAITRMRRELPVNAICTSPQQEETLALLALDRLGEASAHLVALEMGVPTVRNTLGRLEQQGRVTRRRVRNGGGTGDVWVFAKVGGGAA